MNHLLYWIFSLLFPTRRDFISGGLGIQARARRCKSYWQPHLNLTKNFAALAIEEDSPKCLAIFGAGRLLDFDLARIPDCVSEVHLYDADPLAPYCVQLQLRALRRRGIEAFYHVEDFTGRFDRWEALLAQNDSSNVTPHSWSQLLASAPALPTLPHFDCVVSLNVMSQLPIYWLDRLEARFGEQAIDPAVRKLFGEALQLEHLQLLRRSAPSAIILIADKLFFYYERDKSPWEVESAAYIPFPPAVEGYGLCRHESWLWHVAPQSLEVPTHGAIHEVRAFHYRRTADETP